MSLVRLFRKVTFKSKGLRMAQARRDDLRFTVRDRTKPFCSTPLRSATDNLQHKRAVAKVAAYYRKRGRKL